MKIEMEVLFYFLKLGATGFGGPLSIISIMQKELVEERKWIPSQEFAQALALIKAMPGALAFQAAVFLGRRRAGYLGGTLAAFGLLFPSFVLMIILAQYYELAAHLGKFRNFFNGMQAASIVLMILGLKNLMQPYLSKSKFWFCFFVGGALFYKDVLAEPLMILGAGLFGILWSKRQEARALLAMPFPSSLVAPSAMLPLEILPVVFVEKFFQLFWVCFRSGAVVFGSGLAIVPLLERDFVNRLHWLSSQEFLDALALGQVTPGPVLMTVTFIGFKVCGGVGALGATLAVFLPSFIHMQTWFPKMVKVLSQKTWINDFLIPSLGVICGILLVTIFKLTTSWGPAALPLLGVVLFCSLISVLFEIPSWALILIGGLIGLFL